MGSPAIAAAVFLIGPDPAPAEADTGSEDVMARAEPKRLRRPDPAGGRPRAERRCSGGLAMLARIDTDLLGPRQLRRVPRVRVTFCDAACADEGHAMRGVSAGPIPVLAGLTEQRIAVLREMPAYGAL